MTALRVPRLEGLLKARSRRPRDGAPYTVVVAISDAVAAERVEAMFQEAGCEVALASTLDGARALLREEVDLAVLSDDLLQRLPQGLLRATRPVVFGRQHADTAMRSGAIDFLSEEAFFDEVTALLERERARRDVDGHGSRTIAITGTRRAGSTLLATLFGVHLPGPRLLVDCASDPRQADRFDLVMGRSVADLVPVAAELTETHLSQTIAGTRVPGLEVLPAPRSWSSAGSIDAGSARAIFDAVGRRFPLLVADVGADPTMLGRAALRGAEKVLVVVTPDRESLLEANDLVDRLEDDDVLDRSSALGVLNRASSRAEIGERLARRVLRFNVSGNVVPPAWWAVERALNQADPLLIEARKLTRAVKALVTEVGVG